MRIFAPLAAGEAHVRGRLAGLNPAPLFTQEMFPALWAVGLQHGIDPVGLVAQSLKETGAGRFTGQVKARFYNTAGIKVRHTDLFPGITDGDRPLAHQTFPNWAVGATAHAQHLCAYANRAITDELIVDPRYVWVIGRFQVTDWSELGGRWAPSPSYGTEIETLIRQLTS